ncbi:MAG TPA: (2Fe-2S)-binding protein [Methylibium sp.]|uniref:(2Fe-2S)-binding protein n=1 Tax=Methylibium sp. TaxID=2067992 RepID=UPI002DC05DE9|nr:(2Fe-2S)-binding protein [Methylibium sp.]HEU4460556.1 (2Fe-2S)-binding protein [Methylibium sp.]
MTPPLAALVAEAARLVPGWQGRVVEAGAAAPPWHATERLAAVRGHGATRHPEAGAAFAALRGWGRLVWQPLYLAVFAVHAGRTRVDLDRLSIGVAADGEVQGYRWAAHATPAAGEAERLRTAAAQAAAGIATLLPRWQACAPLHAKAARRTCADCVLAAVLALRRRRRWTAARTRAVGARWLDALALHGESGFFSYRDCAGDEALGLERKVCCLDFRCRDAQRCATCPRRPLPERIACLNARR